MERIGFEIKKRREYLGIKRVELKKLANMHYSTLQNIEMIGRRIHGLPMALRIANVLFDNSEDVRDFISRAKAEFDGDTGKHGMKIIDWNTGKKPEIKDGTIQCGTCDMWMDEEMFTIRNGKRNKTCKKCCRRSAVGKDRRERTKCECGKDAVDTYKGKHVCRECLIGETYTDNIEDRIYIGNSAGWNY